MLPWFKRKASDFFTPNDKEIIVAAIKNAELQTSGEVRVYIERDCQYPEPLKRAIELFEHLNMHQTDLRNGVLVYVAIKSRKLAIFGDVGIYEQVGKEFWEEQINKMVFHFNKNDYAEGIATIVEEVGKVLRKHFPYNEETDINELPDDIVFGN